jgi:hypothetical protein
MTPSKSELARNDTSKNQTKARPSSALSATDVPALLASLAAICRGNLMRCLNTPPV